jgi:hypothetical protein
VAITDVGLVARYRIAEAASGQAPTALVDTGPHGEDVPIPDYGGSNLNFVTESGRIGLRSTSTAGDQRAQLALGPTNPIRTDLASGQKFTFEIVYQHGSGFGSGSRIFGLNGSAGQNGAMMLKSEGSTVYLSFNNTNNIYAGWTPGGGIERVFIVIDTTQAASGDRCKVSTDGGALVTTANSFGLNETLTIDATCDLIFFNRSSSGSYGRSVVGALFYAAIYNVAFDATRVADHDADLSVGDDSGGASPTVPSVTVDPTDKTITEGNATTFSVTATGTPAPTYQWQTFSGSWGDISGATSSTYTTPTLTLSDNGKQYRCVVTNSEGSDTSAVAVAHVLTAEPTPTIVGVVTARTIATNTTSHAITIPTHAIGDTILVVFSRDGATANTPNNGFTSRGSAVNGAIVIGEIFSKVAQSTSETLTITSATEQSSHITYVIRPGAGNELLLSLASANSSSTNSNPPALTPSGGFQNYLWIATRSGDSTVVATVAPASFSSLQSIAAAGTGGASSNSAVRSLNAATLDPGTFTSASEQWVSFTIALWQMALPDDPPVATGPLTYIDVIPTGGRISGFSAVDAIDGTVSGWRYRLGGGSWVEFGGPSTSYFDLPSLTEGASVFVEVEAKDSADQWSNTLSKTIIIGLSSVSVVGLDFELAGRATLKQTTSPTFAAPFTLVWWEMHADYHLEAYCGGYQINRADGTFTGKDGTMFVGHNCAGTYDATTGQRDPGVTTTVFHEIAAMAETSGGQDRIASHVSYVEAGETRQSFPLIYAEWVPRAATFNPGSPAIIVEYVDCRDMTKVIRQPWNTADGLTGAAVAAFIGCVPWDDERYRAKTCGIQQFSGVLTKEQIVQTLYEFSDDPSVPGCVFSNVRPTLDVVWPSVVAETVQNKLPGADASRNFILVDGNTPTAFSDEIEVAVALPVTQFYLVT